MTGVDGEPNLTEDDERWGDLVMGVALELVEKDKPDLAMAEQILRGEIRTTLALGPDADLDEVAVGIHARAEQVLAEARSESKPAPRKLSKKRLVVEYQDDNYYKLLRAREKILTVAREILATPNGKSAGLRKCVEQAICRSLKVDEVSFGNLADSQILEKFIDELTTTVPGHGIRGFERMVRARRGDG